MTTTAGPERIVPIGSDRTIEVRPARPDDAGGLADLYDTLSDADRQLRFFSVYHPDAAFFAAMATEADRGGARLVAVLHDPEAGEAIIGEAGYTALPNGDGELGMAVAPAWRGWLGAYLLDALIEEAAAAGVPNIEADVLTTNRSMLALLRSRGMAVVDHEDWTVVRLIVGTRGTRPEWPGPHDRPRVLVEGAGGRWHAEGAARAAGLQVLTCPGPRDGRRRCPVLDGQACPLAADADVIVVSRPTDDERWWQVMAGHAQTHPGVPVLIEPLHADDPLPEGVCPVPSDADVVAFVGARAGERPR